MRLIKNLSFLFLLSLVCSCGPSSYLVTDLEYGTEEDLACTHVHTPAPCEMIETDRQSLLIRWKVPKRYAPLSLEVVLLKENLEEEVKFLSCCEYKGRFLLFFPISRCKEARGILSYQVRLYDKENRLIHEDTHKMWVPLQPKLKNTRKGSLSS
jgi:hypothetical protein